MAPLDPNVIGGLLGVGGSLLSSVFNTVQASAQNRLNYRLLQEQNRFNLDMWHKQNAYNTPLAQRQRLEQAGINPFLALGQVGTGIAQGVTSAQAAPAVGAQMENPMLSAVGAAANIANIKAQEQLIAAQTNKVKAETQNIGANTQVINANKALIDYTLYRSKKFEEADFQLIQEQIRQTTSQTELAWTQKEYQDFARINIQPKEVDKLNAEITNINRSAEYLIQQGMLSKAQVAKVYSEVLKIRADARGVELNNNVLERIVPELIRNANLNNLDTLQDINNKNIQSEIMQKDNDYYVLRLLLGAIEPISTAYKAFKKGKK